MAPADDDLRKQAEDLLKWASDCEAVAKKFRAHAADLQAQMKKPRAVMQQQQQIQPKADDD